MTTKKNKFQQLVSKEVTNTINKNRDRIHNRNILKEAQQIALKILNKLDDLGWTQEQLAEKMELTTEQVAGIVKGKTNLTLDTQIKLQEVLNIPILATYYEQNSK